MWKLCDAIHLRPAAKYNRQSADFHGSGTCLTTRQQRDSPWQNAFLAKSYMFRQYTQVEIRLYKR